MSTPFYEFVAHTLARIQYKSNSDWIITQLEYDDVLIQHVQYLKDVNAGIRAITNSFQPGRKWYLHPSSTEEEIFKTALHAVEAFEKHEARENFKVDGVAVDNPHRTWTIPNP